MTLRSATTTRNERRRLADKPTPDGYGRGPESNAPTSAEQIKSVSCLKNQLVVAMIVLLATSIPATCKEIFPAGKFSDNGMDGWEQQKFAAETQYRIVNTPGRRVLCALSEQSASGLTRPVSVDLELTPYINWSWRVDRIFLDTEEQTKSGDDFPARIFVMNNPGTFRTTQVLNYVWAGNIPINSIWSSPFAGNHIKLIAAQSGSDKLGQWQHEKRNVRTDFRNAFGEEITSIDAIALMTDTDNSGQFATACYGDIYFSAE